MKKLNSDLGWLILRVATALMMIFPHGWSKLAGFSAKMNVFPDPLGIGSVASLTSTVFIEFFCQIFIIIGLKTRWFSLLSAFTMAVAAFMVHGGDPWMRKEKAVLYAVVYLALFISNGGKYSVSND